MKWKFKHYFKWDQGTAFRRTNHTAPARKGKSVFNYVYSCRAITIFVPFFFLNCWLILAAKQSVWFSFFFLNTAGLPGNSSHFSLQTFSSMTDVSKRRAIENKCAKIREKRQRQKRRAINYVTRQIQWGPVSVFSCSWRASIGLNEFYVERHKLTQDFIHFLSYLIPVIFIAIIRNEWVLQQKCSAICSFWRWTQTASCQKEQQYKQMPINTHLWLNLWLISCCNYNYPVNMMCFKKQPGKKYTKDDTVDHHVPGRV